MKKGSNSIWEHALRESGTKVKIKKPGPRDKLQYVLDEGGREGEKEKDRMCIVLMLL